MEIVRLQDNRRLGIATLGALAQHPRIAAFREFLEGWYLSYFHSRRRPWPANGWPSKRRLSIHGDNLGNVVQYMQREHPDKFDGILKKIAGRVPGIDKIDAQRSEDGRLLLRFNDRGFVDPFYAQQMSDGTLKLFAYLLLMEDPDPRHSSASKSRKTASTTSCWKSSPPSFASTPPANQTRPRFS